MIDPIQLQSLVDGESTIAERRAFLSQCEGNPQQWKTLALALLEEQQFRKQFTQIGVKQQDPKNPLPSDNFGSIGNPSTLKPEPLNVLPTYGLGNAGVPGGSVQSRWSTWGPVLAAGLLAVMGFVGGRTFSGLTRESPSSDLVANTQVVGELPRTPTMEQKSPISLVADSDPYHGMPETDLRVRLPSTDYEIPIFDATNFDPTIALAKQEIEIQELNKRLRKQGFEIDMKPEYVTGKLQDGRQVIVPVHQVGLRQYGQ